MIAHYLSRAVALETLKTSSVKQLNHKGKRTAVKWRLIKQKKDKDLLQGINVSKEIYRNGDNAARAALMKTNFFSYYDQMQKNEKVFFKKGSNQLAKGMNLQTNLYDTGNAIYELSQRGRTGFANVYLMCAIPWTKESSLIIF